MTQSNNRILMEIITSLSLAMDLEEDIKLYHAWRVALLAQAMGETMEPVIRNQLFFAGLLHDIGGIGLPDHVVHYPTLEEQKTIPQIVAHCYKGASIANALPGLSLAAEYIKDHHEMWDGSGYPKQKRGEEISLGGQILRLADTFDLVLRGYGELGRPQLMDKMARKIGQEYSQEVYDAFKQVIGKGVFYHRLTRENSLAFFLNQLEDRLSFDLAETDCDIEEVLKIFAQVIDTKHHYTKGHSERVALYSEALAKSMGLSQEVCCLARWAGLLHDAGKLAIPRRILDKPTSLNLEEMRIIRLHPVLTMEILGYISAFEEVALAAGYHHERYDGRGYPDNLAGEEIPLLARIMAVADAFDAMTSDRPYQKTKTFSEALAIIKANSGSQFDPKVVEVAEALHNTPVP